MSIFGRVLDEGIADGPLARHLPVEHLRAGRHLGTLERQEALDDVERRGDAGTRDAAADRIKLFDQHIRRRALISRCGHRVYGGFCRHEHTLMDVQRGTERPIPS